MWWPFRKKAVARVCAGESANAGREHGKWGEDVAAAWLASHGYSIVERNARPYAPDRRLEIDIVAYEKKTDALVFVEVKQHARVSPFQRRLRSVDSRKRQLLLCACRAWMRTARWRGSHRFDVIEVYGTPEARAPPRIDHIERVRLFTPPARFVDWYGD